MEKKMKINYEIKPSGIGRRNFIKSTGAAMIGVAGIGILTSEEQSTAKKFIERTKADRLKQMASNSYAVNQLFKRRIYPGRAEPAENIELKKKYGEITLLDFPQFSKVTYPGVTAMDLWSSLFGDITDDSMFTRTEREGQTRFGDFDPSALSSKRYLDKLADKIASSGLKAVHISNNAPRNIADLNEESRREGIRVAKLWLDAAKTIGVRSMRVNTGVHR
jgi:hypothetical protein